MKRTLGTLIIMKKKKFFQVISVKVVISAWFESMLLLITLERNY
jgi:hypothetical protein